MSDKLPPDRFMKSLLADTFMTSTYVDRCKPYKVKMQCGHIETRMMREATAGVPWTPETVLTAPYAKCTQCDLSKQGARPHA